MDSVLFRATSGELYVAESAAFSHGWALGFPTPGETVRVIGEDGTEVAGTTGVYGFPVAMAVMGGLVERVDQLAMGSADTRAQANDRLNQLYTSPPPPIYGF